MNRRKFIETGAMGLAFISTPSILKAKSNLVTNLLSDPEIKHPIVLRNTQLLLEEIIRHNKSYEEIFEYVEQNLDQYPLMETENREFLNFYNKNNLAEMHPRQISRAYLFMKSLNDSDIQKSINLYLVDDFYDESGEFGGIVSADQGKMTLEHIQSAIIDNHAHSLPMDALNKPHLASYHCHAVYNHNSWLGILSGEDGDIGNIKTLTEIFGESHQLLFNLHNYGFEVSYYGGFMKENKPELFHLRLGNFFNES